MHIGIYTQAARVRQTSHTYTKTGATKLAWASTLAFLSICHPTVSVKMSPRFPSMVVFASFVRLKAEFGQGA